MSFLDRLFGRHGSQEEVDAVLYQPRDKAKDPRPWDNHTSVKVAGESFYQPALQRIAGRRGSEAVRLEDVPCELVCDPDNEHDPRAVKVMIRELHVGHLSKGNARTYCRRIEREGGQVSLSAFVGAHEGGLIGVRVKVPNDHPIQTPLR